MGSVSVEIGSGGLGGTIQTADGVCGLVLTGTAADTYTLGTPIRITGLASLAAANITEANNAFGYRQVKEFYDTAGDGAVLYLMLVPDTILIDDMADKTNANGAKKLLDYAAGKIKLLGIMTDDTALAEAPTTDNGINDDIAAAITNLQAMAVEYAAGQMPFRGIIGGSSYTGTSGDLVDQTEGSNNKVAVLIGDTEASEAACLGLLLGAVAALPVQRKISRVRNGALPISEAYVGTIAIGDTGSDEDLIAAAGYITFKTYPLTAGFFFSGDAMCTATSDDFALLARGRIIDKAQVLAYKTFVQEVDDEVLVDPDTGKMDAGYCKGLEQTIVNLIENTMGAGGEISAVRAFVDPEQNVLSTNKVVVSVGIIPVGYATEIVITLGYENPALSN